MAHCLSRLPKLKWALIGTTFVLIVLAAAKETRSARAAEPPKAVTVAPAMSDKFAERYRIEYARAKRHVASHAAHQGMAALQEWNSKHIDLDILVYKLRTGEEGKCLANPTYAEWFCALVNSQPSFTRHEDLYIELESLAIPLDMAHAEEENGASPAPEMVARILALRDEARAGRDKMDEVYRDVVGFHASVKAENKPHGQRTLDEQLTRMERDQAWQHASKLAHDLRKRVPWGERRSRLHLED